MNQAAENNSDALPRDRSSKIAVLVTAVVLPASIVALASLTRSALAESFAAVVAIIIILPPLAVTAVRFAHRMTITLAVAGSLGIALFTLPVAGAQYCWCVAVVISAGVFILGATSLARRLPFDPFACSMFITMTMSLWLSWPIWLSERLAEHDSVVNALVVTHPLLALNGQLLDQAIWTERPRMYQWTALNQDVPYAVPSTVGWTVLFHGGVGVVLLCVSKCMPIIERKNVLIAES